MVTESSDSRRIATEEPFEEIVMKPNDSRLVVKQLLDKIPLLSGLPSAEKAALVPLLNSQQARAGRFVLREGTKQRGLLFVAEGQLKVCRMDRQGKEVILALLVAGDFFGEIATLTDTPRSADVVAMIPSQVLTLESGDFYRHIERYTALSRGMLEAMARRIHNSTQKITELALYDVACRVARALWALGEVRSEGTGSTSVLHEIPTHQMIAGMVGTSREVVSRALKSLEREGHIIKRAGVLRVVTFP